MPKNVNLDWVISKWSSTFQTELTSKLLDQQKATYDKFLQHPFKTFMELWRVKDPIKISVNVEYYFACF